MRLHKVASSCFINIINNLKCNFSHRLQHCDTYSVYCTETFVPNHKVKRRSNSETYNINSTNHRLSKRLKSCISTTMLFLVSLCSYLRTVSSAIRSQLPSCVTPRYRKSHNKTIKTTRAAFKKSFALVAKTLTGGISLYRHAVNLSINC
jgi:hypothetical protein